MATPLFLVLATLGAGAPASAAPSAGALVRVREYVATYSTRTTLTAHLMIPAWARKYNMNCSGCHYPAPPRLNATGMRFKWAGYRMPEEIGEKNRRRPCTKLRGRARRDPVRMDENEG